MVRQTEIPFYRVFCALRVFLSDVLLKMVFCSCYQQNDQVKNSHKGPESRIETQEYTIKQLSLVFRHVGLQYMAKSVTVGVTLKWETAAASYYSFFLGVDVFIFP